MYSETVETHCSENIQGTPSFGSVSLLEKRFSSVSMQYNYQNFLKQISETYSQNLDLGALGFILHNDFSSEKDL